MGVRWVSQLKDRSLVVLARGLSADWTRPHWRILCYHGVRPEEQDSFRAQLLWFSARFTFCTVSEGVELLKNGLSRPILSVTFDDGDQTVYDAALPVLESLGVRATLYVTADYVLRGCLYRNTTGGKALSAREIRDWASRGHEVGSHSLTHAPMTLCSRRRFEQEAISSKTVLEQMISQPVVHFSYPWGQHSRWTLERLKQLGVYRTGATTDRGAMGSGHDLLCLKRDIVHAKMLVAEIEAIMKLADRFYWLRYLKRHQNGYWETRPEISWDELV